MGKVFSSGPGAVAITDDPQAQGTIAVVTVPGLGSLRVAVTRVTIHEQANFQFLHTLGNFIYLYVFGDRIGQLTVSGLAFHKVCEGSTVGLADVRNFYQQNKLSRRASPVQVTIGTSPTLDAFLAGAMYDVIDPETKICQFSLSFALVPEEE